MTLDEAKALRAGEEIDWDGPRLIVARVHADRVEFTDGTYSRLDAAHWWTGVHRASEPRRWTRENLHEHPSNPGWKPAALRARIDELVSGCGFEARDITKHHEGWTALMWSVVADEYEKQQKARATTDAITEDRRRARETAPVDIVRAGSVVVTVQELSEAHEQIVKLTEERDAALARIAVLERHVERVELQCREAKQTAERALARLNAEPVALMTDHADLDE